MLWAVLFSKERRDVDALRNQIEVWQRGGGDDDVMCGGLLIWCERLGKSEKVF